MSSFKNIALLVVILLGLAAVTVAVSYLEPLTASAQPSADENAAEQSQPIPPSERDPDRLWCNEHGVYEDECVICHPELAGKTEEKRDPNRLWCNEHGVYEDECVICHPELAGKTEEKRDPNRLWCNEHGVYEDECVICHPELAGKTEEKRDPNRLWCNEHGVYEDECVICHPELAATEKDGPANAPSNLQGLMCKEHGVYEINCGICHPELLANLGLGEGLKVRFESMDSVRKAGVRTGYPGEASIAPAVAALGELSYNENKLAIISPYADGVLREIHSDVGDEVEKGQILAEINSDAVAERKSALVTALADHELRRQTFGREQKLFEEEVSSRQELDEAQAAYTMSKSKVSQARQALLNLGFTHTDVGEIARTGATTSLLPVRAPFPGTIVERTAVLGEPVESGTSLFRLADLSTMWMELSIPENQFHGLRKGMTIRAEFDALPGETFEGELTWIAPSVDESTRTVQARAVIPNPESRLKRGLFGRVRVEDSVRVSGLTVPKEALQVVDGRAVVFAKLEEDLFETRLVRLGPARENQVTVLEGLKPGEPIAISESYILKSELLKARLGAGCVHE